MIRTINIQTMTSVPWIRLLAAFVQQRLNYGGKFDPVDIILL